MIRKAARILSALALLAALGVAQPALALTLDEAKSQGLVGETTKGYLGVVEPNDEARRLVDEINLQRRQHYREIARKNGTSLEAVEAIVGKKLIGRAGSGEIVQNENGEWVRKP